MEPAALCASASQRAAPVLNRSKIRLDRTACDDNAGTKVVKPSCQIRDWEHFEHMADIGVRGFGATKAAAFENAARALIAAIADLDAVRPAAEVRIECRAPDDDLLLFEWLNALIYQMATRKMLFARFAVAIEDGHLRGAAWGEVVDVARHAPAAEAKGATLTALRVAPADDGGWLAQCVVDV